MDKKALIESGKTLVRTLIFAVVAWLLSAGVVGGLLDLFGAGLSPEVKLQLTAVITFILTQVDKNIHDSASKANGLLPKTNIT